MLPRLTVVLSTGRSGTSLLTLLFRDLGAVVPQPEVPPDEANPKGYGEPAWLVDFQQTVLYRAGVHNSDARPSAWQAVEEVLAADPSLENQLRHWLKEQLAGGVPLIIKDPRSIWLIGLWRRCANSIGVDPAFAIMARHPTAVVASKRTWFDQAEGPLSLSAGWVNIMLRVESETRGSTRMVATYEDLSAAPAQALQRMARQADFGIEPELLQKVTGSVDRQLNRATRSYDVPGMSKQLKSLLDETWEGLDGLAAKESPRDPGAEQKLDEARASYDEWYRSCEDITASSIRAAEIKGRAFTPQPWTL